MFYHIIWIIHIPLRENHRQRSALFFNASIRYFLRRYQKASPVRSSDFPQEALYTTAAGVSGLYSCISSVARRSIIPTLKKMTIVALCLARSRMLSLGGIAVRPSFLVRITVWLTPGSVLFLFQCSRSCNKGTDSRYHLIWNSKLFKGIHLFPVRTKNGWITGMDPRGHQPIRFCFLHHRKHFFQRHSSTVINRCIRLCIFKDLFIDQRTSINNDVCPVNDLFFL